MHNSTLSVQSKDSRISEHIIICMVTRKPRRWEEFYFRTIMIIPRLLLTAWIKIDYIRFARTIVQISTYLGPICHSLGLIIDSGSFIGTGIVIIPWHEHGVSQPDLWLGHVVVRAKKQLNSQSRRNAAGGPKVVQGFIFRGTANQAN